MVEEYVNLRFSPQNALEIVIISEHCSHRCLTATEIADASSSAVGVSARQMSSKALVTTYGYSAVQSVRIDLSKIQENLQS
jgi:hypothetical protein